MWDGQLCSDWEILNLVFPKTRKEKEIVWLISNYVQFTWEAIEIEADLSLVTFFGFLTFKYRETMSSSCWNFQGLDQFK